MAKRRKLTKTQAFRKNLNRRIKAMQKRGYYFDPEDILAISGMNIWQLRKEYSDTALYQKAVWISPKTQEVIQGTTRREMERREAARKAVATRKRKALMQELSIPDEGSIILTNLLSDIASLETSIQDVFRNTVSDAVKERGRNAVALSVQEHSDEFDSILRKLRYKLRKTVEVNRDMNIAITRFATILYDRPLSGDELFRYAEAEKILSIEQSLEDRGR